MVKVHYARKENEHSTTAKARINDVKVSWKRAYNVCRVLRGLHLHEARDLLNDVLDHKRCIPFFRYRTGLGRTTQAKEWGTNLGRWPKNACKAILDLLKNAESNCEFKRLDADEMVVWHLQIQRARPGMRRIYRAHGRINPFRSHPCHIELILRKADETVPPPKGTQKYKLLKLTKDKVRSKKLVSEKLEMAI